MSSLSSGLSTLGAQVVETDLKMLRDANTAAQRNLQHAEKTARAAADKAEKNTTDNKKLLFLNSNLNSEKMQLQSALAESKYGHATCTYAFT